MRSRSASKLFLSNGACFKLERGWRLDDLRADQMQAIVRGSRRGVWIVSAISSRGA